MAIPYAYCTVQPYAVQWCNSATFLQEIWLCSITPTVGIVFSVKPLYGTRLHCTVWLRYWAGAARWLYGDTMTKLAPKPISKLACQCDAKFQCPCPYCPCLVSHAFMIIQAPVRYNENPQNRSYGDTVCKIMPTCPNRADLIIVKGLKPVLCSSCGGVPLNFKNNSCRIDNLLLPIIWAWFRPLLILIRQYL